VWNWCPLAFMAASGANLTPDKLPRTGRAAAAQRALESACDGALAAVIDALEPAHVVGFGAFAADRARRVLADDGGRDARVPPVMQVLHPSPASPAANRGWAEQVDRALAPILSGCASRS
jgi:single-strand selective monofunctional uracil DNA glycosylase